MQLPHDVMTMAGWLGPLAMAAGCGAVFFYLARWLRLTYPIFWAIACVVLFFGVIQVGYLVHSVVYVPPVVSRVLVLAGLYVMMDIAAGKQHARMAASERSKS